MNDSTRDSEMEAGQHASSDREERAEIALENIGLELFKCDADTYLAAIEIIIEGSLDDIEQFIAANTGRTFPGSGLS